MADFPLPTVHLNGTGRKMLNDDYTAAYCALQTAIRAFQSIEFHARDYYTQGVDAFTRARHHRDTQLQHLAGVQHYLETHLVHLGE